MAKQFGKIKNIEDFRASFADKQRAEQEEKSRRRFGEVVGENIDQFPPGCQFASGLPGVSSISVLKQPNGKDLYVVVFYKDKNGRDKHETFPVDPEGVKGAIPKDLAVTKEQIFDEVMDNLDKVGLDFWYGEAQEILPPDWPVPPKEQEGPEKPPIAEDPRRIEFLRKQPDARFGFFSRDGFRGYYGFFFDKFIVLENPKCENAAYFIDLPEGLSDEERKMAATRSGRNKLIEKYWEPYEGRGKWEMFTAVPEAERLIHKPVDNWINQMEGRLNAKNPLPPNSRQVTFKESRAAGQA